jgi:hypothetical protein
MEKGSSPGVAFYESMDQMISGEYLDDVIGNISEAIINVKNASKAKGNKELSAQADDVLVSLAQVGDWLKNLWTGTKSYTGMGGGGSGGKWQTGPLVALVQEMRKNHPAVAQYLNAVKMHGSPKDVFEKSIRPVLNPYMAFLGEARKRGWDLKGYPDLRNLWANKEFIDPATIAQFTQNFDTVMTDLGEDLAIAIQKSKTQPKTKPEGLPKGKTTSETPATQPTDKIDFEQLKKEILPPEKPSALISREPDIPAELVPPVGAGAEGLEQPQPKPKRRTRPKPKTELQQMPDEALGAFEELHSENADLKNQIRQLRQQIMQLQKGQPG